MSEKETHGSGLLYFMPHWIFEHPDLTNTEKMTYALLAGLSFGDEKKQCWPSDEYIGERVDVLRQQANAIVKKLTEIGAISKIVVPHPKNPFKKQRIITVYLEPQKSFTKSDKPDSRGSGKPDSPESEKPDLERIKNIGNEGSMNENKFSSSRVAKKAPPSPSAEASELSTYFFSRIKDWKKDFKGNPSKWAVEFDKMFKKDERTVVKAKELIDWLAEEEAGFAYIQSAKKFRDSFDEQESRMGIKKKKKRLNANREYCQWMQAQHPHKVKNMTFDEMYVKNLNTGKGLSLDEEPEQFRQDFFKIYEV